MANGTQKIKKLYYRDFITHKRHFAKITKDNCNIAFGGLVGCYYVEIYRKASVIAIPEYLIDKIVG